MNNLKDTLTTVLAIILIVAGAVNTYIQSIGGGDIDWYQLVLAIVAAVIAYFTGKTADGKKKSFEEIAKQKSLNV